MCEDGSMNSGTRAKWRWEIAYFGSILVSVAVLIASELGQARLQASHEKAVREMRASAQLGTLLGLVADAETSQRGYLLTERVSYLDTYNTVLPAINPLVLQLRDAYYDAENTSMLNEFSSVTATLREKLSELELTLALVRQGKKDMAKELTLTDIGKEKMDLLRSKVATLQARERENTDASSRSWAFNRNLSRASVALVTLLNIVLLLVLFRWLRADWELERMRRELLAAERIKLDRLVAERTAQLEILASHLQQVSENEKASIARELHDELGAILTASKMDVSWVRRHLTSEQSALADKLGRAVKNLDQGVQAKRRIVENLRPSTLTAFGLVVALRELAEQMQAGAGWTLELDLPEEDLVLPDDAGIALYRIAQESINNALKYASAKTLWVRLRCDAGTARLEIEDDGVGFEARDMRPKSHGLAGMRQRMVGLGGSLEIDSRPGEGTRVCAIMRIAPAPREEQAGTSPVTAVAA